MCREEAECEDGWMSTATVLRKLFSAFLESNERRNRVTH